MNAPATIHAILYARPQVERAEGQAANDQASFDPRALNVPFERTLEEVLAGIASEPRGYAEPDGSFSLHDENSSGRIDGEVYDFFVEGGESRVHHVDVRGPADGTLWRRVFDALSPRGAQGIVVYLSQSRETIPADEFLDRLPRWVEVGRPRPTDSGD